MTLWGLPQIRKRTSTANEKATGTAETGETAENKKSKIKSMQKTIKKMIGAMENLEKDDYF